MRGQAGSLPNYVSVQADLLWASHANTATHATPCTPVDIVDRLKGELDGITRLMGDVLNTRPCAALRRLLQRTM